MKKLSLCLVVLTLITCFTACSKRQDKNAESNQQLAPIEYVANDNIVSSGKVDGFYYIEYADFIEITDCSLADGSKTIEFPSKIADKPVKIISVTSLRGNQSLTSAVIPDTVTEIGNYLFQDCSKLSTIIMPNSITRVGCSAFFGTSWFDSLTDEFAIIGDGVLIKYNGDGGDVVIPETVKYLSDAFSENTRVLSIKVPQSVVGISDYAFFDCTSLTEIDIPSHISDIGAQAFAGTIWLMAETEEFLTLGNEVLIAYLGNDTNVTIPDNIKYISGAFASNESVISVTVPSSVKCVFSGSFYECSALRSVVFLGADTQIEETTFASCHNLTDVVLPIKLKAISDRLFYSCTSLKKINLPKFITYIGTSAFYSCTELAEISLPETLKTINSAAFFGCVNLEKISLPDSVNSMGDVAVACCYKLKEINIPKSLTDISTGLFSYCREIKQLHFSTDIKTIGEGAFEGCNDLLIYIEGQDTTLGKDIFLDCTDGKRKIFCKKGSVAESYAKKNKIKYSIIKD